MNHVLVASEAWGGELLDEETTYFASEAYNSQELEAARSALVATYPLGEGFVEHFHDYTRLTVDRMADLAVWPLIKWDNARRCEYSTVSEETIILRSSLVATVMAGVKFQEEALRYNLAEELYGGVTKAKRRKGLYRGSPLERYCEYHRKLPPNVGKSSPEQRDFTRHIHSRLDGQIAALRIGLSRETRGVPITRVAHLYVGAPAVRASIESERDLMQSVLTGWHWKLRQQPTQQASS